MIGQLRLRIAIGAGLAAALSLTALLPAQAAGSPGWRRVSSHHFGPARAADILASVVATSKNGAWAFGAEETPRGKAVPLAERWNGRSWRGAALPSGLTGAIGAASAPAANDVWAAAAVGGYVLHYNGSRWSVARRFKAGQELTGVTAFSPTDVWVFGGAAGSAGAGTWHLHGRTWTKVTGIADSIGTASALSRRNIWAVGGPPANIAVPGVSTFASTRNIRALFGRTAAPLSIVAHYNGSTWKRVTSKALNGVALTDILALSPGNVWATGLAASGNGTPALVRLKGTTWTRVKLPWPVFPLRVAPDGGGGLWITGIGPGGWRALHLSKAGAWRRYALPGTGVILVPGLAHIPGTASMWAAGSVIAGPGLNAAIWAFGPVG